MPRLWTRDIVHFGRRAQVAGVSTTLNVAPLAAARRRRKPPTSWPALLAKGLALVAAGLPEMRQAYLSLPWPHLYEHPCSVANILVARSWHGEAAVLFDTIPHPERLPLDVIDRRIQSMKLSSTEGLGGFRRIVRFTRLPFPLRRIIYGAVARGLGAARAKYFGTYCVISLPVSNTVVMQSFNPVTLTLYHGPVAASGDISIQALWDQYVLTPGQVLALLRELEKTLNLTLAEELGQGVA